MDLFDRIMELGMHRYECASIMAILMNEVAGKENEELVRALGGLCGGGGYTGNTCGCMTAGCCILSAFLGRGTADADASEAYRPALQEFTEWFTEEMQTLYGSIDCRDILQDNPANKVTICPKIIGASFEKCLQILEDAEVDL